MASKGPLEFEIEGVVLPADHSVYKLFPGKTYRLAKAMRATNHVFLDISGLDKLSKSASDWTDDALLRIISLDRIARQADTRSSPGRKKKRSGSQQDTKRLSFLRGLLFTAKKGDLILVPLGEGFDGRIAVGELSDAPGKLDSFTYEENEQEITTYGRKVTWLAELHRANLSSALVKTLLSPTAFHLVQRTYQEDLYIRIYGTFAFGDVYVAKFETDKERLGSQEYANIGVMFNGLAVAHDAGSDPSLLKDQLDEFYVLGIEYDGSATIEFRKNSPISAIVRTIGPLAFSAAVVFSGAAAGKKLAELEQAVVVARPVGSATDRCRLEVPPDLATTAVGLGQQRYLTFCRMRQKVEDEAHVRSPARLKKRPKALKRKP